MENNKTKAVDRFYMAVMLDGPLAIIVIFMLFSGRAGAALTVLASTVPVTAACVVEFKANRL